MGQYLLLHRLSKGGMGEIFLAKYDDGSQFGKICVIKRLRSESTADPSIVRRFLDELRIVVQLRHSRICRVLDVGKVNHNYYLAMEFVDGADLAVLHELALQQGKRISLRDVFEVAKSVLEALDYAHALRDGQSNAPLELIHRDISPENIMVDKNGSVKLIDFGLANSVLKREITQPEFVYGKMSYMAPEQARGDSMDHRIDFFSVGVVLFELISGESYYGALTEEEVWETCGQGDYVPATWGSIPEPIRRILAKALQPDPEQRYVSGRAFLEEIVLLQTTQPLLFGLHEAEISLTTLLHQLLAEKVGSLTKLIQTPLAAFRPELERTKTESISVLSNTTASGIPSSESTQTQSDSSPPFSTAEKRVPIADETDPSTAKDEPTGKERESRLNQTLLPTLVVNRDRVKKPSPAPQDSAAQQPHAIAAQELTEVVFSPSTHRKNEASDRSNQLPAYQEIDLTNGDRLRRQHEILNTARNQSHFLSWAKNRRTITIGVGLIALSCFLLFSLFFGRGQKPSIGDPAVQAQVKATARPAARSPTRRPNQSKGNVRKRRIPQKQAQPRTSRKSMPRDTKEKLTSNNKARPLNRVSPSTPGQPAPASQRPSPPKQKEPLSKKSKSTAKQTRPPQEVQKPRSKTSGPKETLQSRIRQLQKTCANVCTKNILRDYTRFQNMDGEKKLAFFRDLNLCEQRCPAP